ncbi:MAG: tetratricopeptide repeat protein [Chloroflexi bacterium]|nr:tetratricopeptide repeat protein [Chloroflexota bacterium]
MMQKLFLGHRYELHRIVGRGGIGAVYEALDRLTGEMVALKRVFAEEDSWVFATKDEGIDNRLTLAREFQTLASLRHPNIIDVIDFGFDDDRQPFFTMTLLTDPENLFEYALGLSVSQKVALIIHVLEAVHYLHRRGIVHRDLKPGNILVNADQVKLLDFGLVRVRDHTTLMRGDGRVAGTINYMAPELVKGDPATVKSDLYAVGVIAFELLSEAPLFRGKNLVQLTQRILHEYPNLDPIPDSLRYAVGRLLAKDPAERQQDAGIVIRDLADAMNVPIPEEDEVVRESYLQAAKFVGRAAEIRQLQQALKEAKNGNGSLWLIGGESGVGKSRLLDEVRAMALVEGAIAVRGQAREEGGEAYHTWRGIIPRLLLETEITDGEAAILKSILPNIEDLLQRPVQDAPEADSDTEQQRLILTILDVFRRQRHPIAVLLEDLHWARESLLILQQVQDIVGGLPLLIIGTFRDDVRRDLPAELPCARILNLQRLSRKSVAELSVSMLGKNGSQPEVVDFIMRESEGNTFFIVEVVRAMAEKAGRLSDIDAGDITSKIMTGGMREIIRWRLNRIPRSYRPVLMVAAVAGRHIDTTMLQTIFPDKNIESWQYACVEAMILDNQEGRWRFAHDKIRETIINVLKEDKRRNVHRKIARAIEQHYSDNFAYAEALTEHWYFAGEHQRSIYYSLNAAQWLMSLARYNDAVRVLQRSTEYVGYIPTDSSLHGTLYKQLGDSLFRLGKYPAAMDYYQRTIASPSDDQWNQIQALNGLSEILWRQGDFGAAMTYADDALQTAKDQRLLRGVALSLKNLGTVAYQRGDYKLAQDYFEQGLAIYESKNDLFGIANMLTSLGMVAYEQEYYAGAEDYFEQCLDLWRELGNRLEIANILTNLGNIFLLKRDFRTARVYLEQSLAIERTMGSHELMIETLGALIYMYAFVSLHKEANECFHEMVQLAASVNTMPVWMDVLFRAAIIVYFGGQPIRAARWVGFLHQHPVFRQQRQLDLFLSDLEYAVDGDMLTALIMQGKQLELNEAIADIEGILSQ